MGLPTVILSIPDINLSLVSAPISIVPPSDLQLVQLSYIRFLNESPYVIQFVGGGQNFPIPAWSDYPVKVTPSLALPISLTQQLISTPVPNMSTILKVSFYTKGDAPPNLQPISLVRQVQVPNDLNIVSGTATNIQDDLRIAGSQTVEATVSGDLNGTDVSLSNDAVLQLGNATRRGQVIIRGSAGYVQVAAILALAGTNISFQQPGSTNNVNFIVNNVQMVNVDSNGLSLLSGTLKFVNGSSNNGSISRFAIDGPFTVVTSGTNCSHTLGVVPDFAFLVADTGNFSSSSYYGVNFGTMTSTIVTAYSNSAGGVRSWLVTIKK